MSRCHDVSWISKSQLISFQLFSINLVFVRFNESNLVHIQLQIARWHHGPKRRQIQINHRAIHQIGQWNFVHRKSKISTTTTTRINSHRTFMHRYILNRFGSFSQLCWFSHAKYAPIYVCIEHVKFPRMPHFAMNANQMEWNGTQQTDWHGGLEISTEIQNTKSLC